MNDWLEKRREARRPVEEAGGGEAEGFEQAEQLLIERAENWEGRSPMKDAFPPRRRRRATAKPTARPTEDEQPSEDERDDRRRAR